MTKQKSLMAVLFLGLVAVGCGYEQPADSDGVTDEATVETDASTTAGPSRGSPTTACACLDKSQVEDCTAATTCTYWVKSGTSDEYYCATRHEFFYCPHYVSKLCRKNGYLRNGIHCCSGNAKWSSSLGGYVCVP